MSRPLDHVFAANAARAMVKTCADKLKEFNETGAPPHVSPYELGILVAIGEDWIRIKDLYEVRVKDLIGQVSNAIRDV